MDGRVLAEAFEEGLLDARPIGYSEETEDARATQELSPAEAALVAERLAALGYLGD
jgi:hypothetical protein